MFLKVVTRFLKCVVQGVCKVSVLEDFQGASRRFSNGFYKVITRFLEGVRRLLQSFTKISQGL